jgi:transposase InsO family protein
VNRRDVQRGDSLHLHGLSDVNGVFFCAADIHDRDPLFTAEFLKIVADAGAESVKLPPRRPNLNAYAERFVRSIKESCLNRMIFFGEESAADSHTKLRWALSQRA